ncbi:MAG: hypothetical protein OEZ01_12005 [Candidatus Heimdallarchaeota archaeon]|nr:hypothetical protein [Candidatus Heimdallarchaeota archaeon]MDH5646728.1 hypothetical protein [Candidatus Heimdallarchaeota archaeon]
MRDFNIINAHLYTTGIGWFTAEGEVSGNSILFPVNDDNFDDFLKTSIISIKDNSTIITNTSFETFDAAQRSKRFTGSQISSSNDKNLFSSTNAVLGLVSFLRGKNVTIILKNTKNGPKKIEGRILGYESITSHSDDKTGKIPVISILTEDKKIEFINVNDFDSIIPVEETVKKKLDEFLEFILAQTNVEKSTNLRLDLLEAGDHIIRISFLAKIPSWKIAYRLLVHKELQYGEVGPMTLELNAIVDNTTLIDWKDTLMTLSTKTPVTFQLDLSSPKNKKRPEVELDENDNLIPPRLNVSRGYDDTKEKDISSAKIMGGSNLMNAFSSLKKSAPAGGLGGGPSLGAPTAPSGGPLSGPSETTSTVNYDFQYSNKQKQQERLDHITDESFYHKSSIDSADKLDQGDVEFQIKHLVNIKNGESSIISLAREELQGNKILYYNFFNHKIHPFKVIEFKNDLGYPLISGPISLVSYTDQGLSFMGEAIIPRVNKGLEFFITYALENNVFIDYYIKRETKHSHFEIEGYKAIKHSIQYIYYNFEIDNSTEDKLQIYLSISSDKDFEPEKGQEIKYKIRRNETIAIVDVDANSVRKLKFTMKRLIAHSVQLSVLRMEQLEELIEDSGLTEEDKKIARYLFELNSKLKDVEMNIFELQTKLKNLDNRRNQINNTLKVTREGSPKESELRNAYMAELNEIDSKYKELDTELQKYQDEAGKIRLKKSKPLEMTFAEAKKNLKSKS